MTTFTHDDATQLSLQNLREEFAPLFTEIAHQAVEREQNRDLPFQAVDKLKASGFTALRVPVEFGGRGISLAQFFELLTDLATADSNVAHLLRGHIAFVEEQLRLQPSEHRDRWLTRIGAGDIIGNAMSERQDLSEITTVLSGHGDAIRVSGVKYYTTGSLYADWVVLSAVRAEKPQQVLNVIVNAHDAGVEISDDWDGFGQQLTASGGLVLDNVPVDERDVQICNIQELHVGFTQALFQLILLAVASGAAQAAVDDAIEFVKPRRRTIGFPGELKPRNQDIVQTVVGQISSKAHAARLIVRAQAAALSEYANQYANGREDYLQVPGASTLAVEVFQSQHVVLELALQTATEIFEVGGASATSTRLQLDRHWRNIRTIASHNPIRYRSRAVGDYLLNGQLQAWGHAASTEREVTSSHLNVD